MSYGIKENITVGDLTATLSLISLRIAQLHSHIEVYRGDDFLSPKEKLMFAELYRLANKDFTSDESDLGKLYGDEELEKIKLSMG